MKRPPTWLAIGGLLGFLFAVSMLSIVTSVIWPGQAELLGPIFCDDARPDAIVVSDTYSSGTGETATNFTLYCVGPRGDHRDVGWFKPFLGICVMNALVLAAVIAAVGCRPWLRRRRRRHTTAVIMDAVGPHDAVIPRDAVTPRDTVIPHDAVGPRDA